MTISTIKSYYFTLSILFLCFSAYADSPAMVATDKVTTGLVQAIASLKAEGVGKVVFPRLVPAPAHAPYFVSAQLKPNHIDYSMSFDNTTDCRGAHYCSTGSIGRDIQGNPTIYFNNQNQEITQKITLSNGHSIYYTPSHAMGDFWPARVEWRCGPSLYTLSWALSAKDERAALIEMVKSMWGMACS